MLHHSSIQYSSESKFSPEKFLKKVFSAHPSVPTSVCSIMDTCWCGRRELTGGRWRPWEGGHRWLVWFGAVGGWRVTGRSPVRFPELTVTTDVPLSKGPIPQRLSRHCR